MSNKISYPLGPSSKVFIGSFFELYDKFDTSTMTWVFKDDIKVSDAYVRVWDTSTRLVLENKNDYLLYYWKNDFLDAFFLLFQKLNWEASVELPHWESFLLLYCCHKINVFVWLN
jgi:hypothetical protein